MITVDLLREVWQDLCEAHKAGISFYSSWTEALDDGEFSYPCAVWRPPTTGVDATDNATLTDRFTLELWYLEQTAADRSRTERDRAYERMEAIARQCWAKFFTTYVADSGTWQGVLVDLTAEDNPSFEAVWDSGASQRTGVRMTVTLGARTNIGCVDDYFN